VRLWFLARTEVDFFGALRDVQRERPVYRSGDGNERDAQGWWGEVIWRTGVGAGVDGRGKDGGFFSSLIYELK
jgi:hypothetical protein